MTLYKVVCDDAFNFNIHTYDFWSYVFSVKLYKGRLFFNREKAERWADECNLLSKQVKETISEKYDKLRKSMFDEEV